jgi:K+-transporting ATPase A subunit
MAVDTPLSALFYSIIVLILLLMYGRFIDIIIHYLEGKSITTEKVEQQKSTLATHDESFISGMMWSDVGRGQ